LTGTLFILAIGLVAWWQQRTLQRLVREETNWQIRLAEENESRRQTALHASLSEARSEGPAHASTDSLPLSVREFFALTDEISADEHKRSQPGEQQKLQDKVERLYARLRATPSNALKEMLAGVESSTMSAEGRRQMPIAILGLLAERDPADAMAVAQTHAASPLAMEVIIRTWVKQDAQAAAQWMMTAEAAGTLPPSLQGDQARLLLLPRLIASNLDGPAIVEMGKLAPGNLDDFLTETVRVLNTAEQRLAFFNRLGQVPDLPADAANQFLRKVGTEISTEAAQSVLLQAAAQWPVEKFDAAAIATSTASIDERTPERAEWLLQNLRGTDREASISKLVETWTHADFNGAAAWLQKQLPSPDRDAAVASFARLVAGREPASAVDWAATIADPASRSASLTRLYRDWARSEPAEAAEYFRDKGLAPTGR
jgi:hypothetical protein